MALPEQETALLKSYLDAQRDHILGILEGLDDDALRRTVLPSGWTCLGLVHHLALDVERFWFRAVVAGEQMIVDGLTGTSDNAWDVGMEVSAESVLSLYRQEIEQANAVIDATPLDSGPVWWPGDLFGDWRIENLRQVMLHVIVETACHAGHLDAVRELIDGRRWLVLTGDSG
jgi:Protein of unknown function (DUF664).